VVFWEIGEEGLKVREKKIVKLSLLDEIKKGVNECGQQARKARVFSVDHVTCSLPQV
jgi:hypothetical protein